MTQTLKHRLRLKALAVLIAIAATPLAANAWTNKPVKMIVPAPPKMLVPPTTTAVIAVSSKPVPMSDRVVLTRETKTQPARPDMNPDSV